MNCQPLEKFIALLLTLLATRLCARPPAADPMEAIDELIARGRFGKAFDLVLKWNPPDVEFHLGFIKQRQAEALRQQGDLRACATFAEAAEHYRKHLQNDPNSTPAMNNRALAMFECTQDRQALSLIQQAIRADDSMEGLYRRNLAELQAKSGDWKSAIEEYGRVLELHPEDETSRRALIDLYAEHDPAMLVDALATLKLPADTAVVFLLELFEKSPAAGEAALLGLAPSLAADIESTPRQDALVAKLRAGARHVAIAELVSLLERRDSDASLYPWWTANALRRAAFVLLAHAVGSSDQGAERMVAAEAYHRLAFAVGDRGDPATATPLLDFLLARTASGAEIDAVAGAMQVGTAPATEAAYELHRAAGIAYAEADVWTIEDSDRDALFHLTAAETISRSLGRELEPGVADYLREAREKAAEKPSELPPQPLPSQQPPIVPPDESPILFGTNLDDVDCSAKVFDNIERALRNDIALRLLMTGYADSRGTDSHNDDLSRRRAARVRDCIAHRIGDARLRINHWGEKYPVATNETAEGQQLNRRVEFDYLRE